MKVLFSSAAVLLAMAGTTAVAAGRDCSVTHHDCYPACIQMTPDGNDCAKTREVCRDVCGPKPVYPSISNTERLDREIEASRFEVMEPMPEPTEDQLDRYTPPRN